MERSIVIGSKLTERKNEVPIVTRISERPVKIIPERSGFKRRFLNKLFYSWRMEQ